MSNIVPFGDRVVVELVEEAYDGVIFIAERRNASLHSLGKVTCATKLSGVNVGDVVMFQYNSTVADACSFQFNGKTSLSLNPKDVLCKLASNKIDIEAITMVGNWVLVSPFINTPKSGIILPDTATTSAPEQVRFRLVKAGQDAVDVNKRPAGTELVLNKNYVNRLKIGADEYAYISQDNVLAAIE